MRNGTFLTLAAGALALGLAFLPGTARAMPAPGFAGSLPQGAEAALEPALFAGDMAGPEAGIAPEKVVLLLSTPTSTSEAPISKSPLPAREAIS